MKLLFRLARPLLHALDPELAHTLTVQILKTGLVPSGRVADEPILHQRLWNHDFPNPVGLAAGFDKNAEVADAMLGFGFGLVEIGSVTPRPQPGNPKPRLFRLPEDRAVINRLGFNSQGLAAVRERLARRRMRHGFVGVNVGKNKDSVDAAGDYAAGISALAPFADYVVCNVSSPNTPGLRALQGREELAALIARAQAALRAASPKNPPPLLIKVAPDLSAEDRRDIAAVATASKVDGLIVSNTTIARPDSLRGRHRAETGGLSGKPLLDPSTAVLRDFYRLTGGRLVLVGVGGIASGADAYAKIRAGASLVQLYTALIYEGPALVAEIVRDLAACLRHDGLSNVTEAIGADHRA